MSKKIPVLLLMFAMFFSGCAVSNQTVKPEKKQMSEKLPVTRVVLYQNGIGYFERNGSIDQDSVTLNVRQDQINDFLKSLTVIDKSKGDILNITLPVEKKTQDKLADIPKQVRNTSGLLGVFNVFRGAFVTIGLIKNKSFSGRIVGVENIKSSQENISLQSGSETLSGWRVTLMKDNGMMGVYPAEYIQTLTINDRNLEIGLEKSLDISLGKGEWKPVQLTVHFSHAKKHDLFMSYIVEMPKWKPSYRLVALENNEVLIQGWAIVDNVSGQEWKNVKLSLISGTPLSFKYDLHSPRFVNRVDLGPNENEMSVAPTTEGSAYAMEKASDGAEQELYDEDKSNKRTHSRSKKSRPHKSSSNMMSAPMMQKEYEVDYAAIAQKIKPQATGKSVGALFRYDITNPITVKDNSSTMVPIVNSKIKGSLVWLFRLNERSEPYRAVYFKNSTTSTLEKGPVALYSKNSFVGEGLMERQESGATTFITFAIDSGVSLETIESEVTTPTSILKISYGKITSQFKYTKTSKFTVKNNKKTDGIAYVRKGKIANYHLEHPKEGVIETDEYYYIPVNVAKQGKATVDLKLSTNTTRTLSFSSSLGMDSLKFYMTGDDVKPEVRKALETFFSYRKRQGELKNEKNRLHEKYRNWERDQNRLRDNIELLRKTKGNKALLQKQIAKLVKLSNKLSKISATIVKSDDEIADIEAKIGPLLEKINL